VIVYRDLGLWQGTLDIRLPDRPGPHPALLYFHGGGWIHGSPAMAEAHAPAFLAMGLAVIAASYRLVDTAPAPAAAEDTAAALAWLATHGEEYGIDPERIVVAGHSAGGCLALHAAYGAGARSAAVVAWNAPTDLVAHRAERQAAGEELAWLERSADPERFAEALSPLACVRPGLPPTMLVHSDRDPRVPHSHAARLAQALAQVGVPVSLATMRSDGHLSSEHPASEVAGARERTRAFLADQRILERNAA